MKKSIFSFLVLSLFFGSLFLKPVILQEIQYAVSLPVVFADDDEDDDESDDEDNEDKEDYYESKSTKVEKIKPIYQKILVPVVKIILDPIFRIDSDGDGLFDGIDPHPRTHEREYFTDDDDDSVPNAFDLHKGEDDFMYYDQDTDVNENGIIDAYESMGNN